MTNALWDPYSDQPYRISGANKTRHTKGNLLEYARTGVTAIGLAPALAWQYATQPPIAERDDDSFVGLSISPEPALHDTTLKFVAELGVRELLIRAPVWEADRIHELAAFMREFPGQRFVVNVLQNREHVVDLKAWEKALHKIVEACADSAHTFQIGNAINRTKWGCMHSGEYLDLQDASQRVQNQWPQHRFLGSSVIDFEPLVTLRTLFNFRNFSIDGCASELYVNRRGAPTSKQFGVFGLEQKIRLLAAMNGLSNRSCGNLWITETNWPLLNTKPWTPNSGDPRSTVDEATQAEYLTDYYRIAWHSGLVERVYWWQLINPGYGLVDHRSGNMRKMPSYSAFADVVNGAFKIPPSS